MDEKISFVQLFMLVTSGLMAQQPAYRNKNRSAGAGLLTCPTK